jgi:hypothetical protein
MSFPRLGGRSPSYRAITGSLSTVRDAMQDHTFTIIVSAIGIVGALGGIVAGHFLTRSGQHDQWLRDNRKQEYRELLTSLAAAYMHIVQYGSGDNPSDSTHLRFDPVRNEGFRTLQDRIFIADDIKKAGIREKWERVVDLCNERGRMPESMEKFDALTAELARMALNNPP